MAGDEREDAGIGDGEPRSSKSRARRPNYRLVFAFAWIALQCALVATAGRRPDGAFGFRMFHESSTLHVALFREVDSIGGRTRVHVDDGSWTARGSDGAMHRLSWYERIPMPYWVFDREMHASYGAATQLARLRGALDDLATHTPQASDLETRRFILTVRVRRNGREPVVHELVSRERDLGPAFGEGR